MTGIADADAAFRAARPQLLGVAYRMLGSVADAEDVVQETWLRWRRAQEAGTDIANVDAWLTTAATRLAIDRLRSAHARRERYVGPWLPEPIVERASPVAAATAPADPAAAVELADSLTFAFLTMLDELDPVERAVVLLADVFSTPYAQVAEAVGRSEAACRQLASRARRRLREHGPAPGDRRPTPDERRVVDELLLLLAMGDMERVLERLSPDVVAITDGGADRRAARRPVRGAERVARFFRNLTVRDYSSSRFEPATVNRRPGVLVWSGDVLDAVLACDVADGRVTAIWVVRNPDKLRSVTSPSADVR